MNANDCCRVYQRFTRYEETRALREANAVFKKQSSFPLWLVLYISATLLVAWLLTR